MDILNFDDLISLKNNEDGKEVLVFKYSPICPISKRIENEFDQWAKNRSEVIIVKVNVIASRSVSNQIADNFNITHESPQLIWLTNDFNVKNSASHYDISESFLRSNL